MNAIPPGSNPADELFVRVRAEFAIRRCQMAWTASGFDVIVGNASPDGMPIDDRIRGLIHHVSLDSRDRTISVIDEWRESRDGEVGHYVGQAWRVAGRIVLGRRPDGSFGIVERQYLSATQGRQEITRIAEELGWRTKHNTPEFIAVCIMAASGLIAALGSLVVLLLR